MSLEHFSRFPSVNVDHCQVQKYGLPWTPLRCVPSVVSVPSESPRTLWAIRLRTETLSECFFGPLQYVQNHLCGKRYLDVSQPCPPHVQNLKTCPHNIGCEVGSRATHQKKCRRVLKNSSPKLQFWSWVLKTRRQNCSFGVEFWKLVTRKKLQFWWRVLRNAIKKKFRRVLQNSSPKLQFCSWVLKTRRQNCSFGDEFGNLFLSW